MHTGHIVFPWAHGSQTRRGSETHLSSCQNLAQWSMNTWSISTHIYIYMCNYATSCFYIDTPVTRLCAGHFINRTFADSHFMFRWLASLSAPRSWPPSRGTGGRIVWRCCRCGWRRGCWAPSCWTCSAPPSSKLGHPRKSPNLVREAGMSWNAPRSRFLWFPIRESPASFQKTPYSATAS